MKYDLEKLLREIAEDENRSAPENERKKILSQKEIQALIAAKRNKKVQTQQ